ncbi:peptide-binding protein [Desulfovibrio subterraneus]|uniref:Peptide-binding protein n=2 Tax=Desulfovibrio subterraneus TaxID=2718620 RepID=A0A7J0BJZ5_9BACT|nr:peptide-binding protein [Desulfovibrio subterraneus]GFM34113.1 peptide-binding protein [Desulfovibrio subterraneus]
MTRTLNVDVLRNGIVMFSLGIFLLLAGCGDSATQEKPAEEKQKTTVEAAPAAEEKKVEKFPVSKPEYGGRLILGTIGDFANMIPILTADAGSHDIASYIYVAPLRYNKDLEVEPWAAERYDVQDDGKRIRIVMRKDVKWEDGEPLTARDVEFTYKLMIDPKTPTPYADDYLQIKKFTLVDDYTFEVEYDTPFARSLITWMHDILPRHLLEGKDVVSSPLTEKPVGAGPYRFKEWERGSKLVLGASDTYFLGKPYISEIVYRVIPDLSTMFLELKAGKLDMMNLTPQQYLFQTKGADWDGKYNKFRYLSFGYAYLGYNLEEARFKDKKVRQALTTAIDRQGLIKGVLLGQGEPTVGPYKPGTWVYNDTIEDYPYDPAKARQMLAEAGWTDTNGDGVIDKDGQPFEFTILTNQGNEQRIKTATIIQSMLRDVGIVVKIRTVEWAAFLKEFVEKGRFDALILGWNILQDPDIAQVWHSSQARPGGLNHGKYRNSELDALLDKGRTTLDRAARKEAYDGVQRILHEDQPYSFLYVPYSLPIVHGRIKGIDPAPAGITHNIDRWWIPKSERLYEVAN